MVKRQLGSIRAIARLRGRDSVAKLMLTRGRRNESVLGGGVTQ